MLTLRKLDIYRKYKGDIDGFTRSGTRQEKKDISNADWYLIDNLAQDFAIVLNKLASPEYESRFNEKVSKSCENEEALSMLRELAGQK